MRREIKEETGITVLNQELFDTDSVLPYWNHNKEIIKVHHTGVFYKITSYTGNIKTNIELYDANDDSKGAMFYDMESLNKDNLSDITILELNKLGYLK